MSILYNDLKFAVGKSVRYHERRKRFFEWYGNICKCLTIISGSSAFVAVSSNNNKFAFILTLVLSIITTMDFIINFSKQADIHDKLRARFYDLLRNMALDEPTEQNLRVWTAERLLIEKDEPPILKALDILCHNSEATALGKNNSIYEVSWCKKLFCHVHSFEGWGPISASSQE